LGGKGKKIFPFRGGPGPRFAPKFGLPCFKPKIFPSSKQKLKNLTRPPPFLTPKKKKNGGSFPRLFLSFWGPGGEAKAKKKVLGEHYPGGCFRLGPHPRGLLQRVCPPFSVYARPLPHRPANRSKILEIGPGGGGDAKPKKKKKKTKPKVKGKKLRPIPPGIFGEMVF